MRIVIAGSDPAGLYAGILLRRARPQWEVAIHAGDEAPAFGCEILSNPVRPEFSLRDAAVNNAILAASHTLSRMRVQRDGPHGREECAIDGLDYRTVARAALLQILRRQAAAAGCAFVSGDLSQEANQADLVLVSDPDKLRDCGEEGAQLFTPPADGETLCARFEIPAEAQELLFAFAQTPHGSVHARSLPVSERAAALVIEARRSVIDASGMAQANASAIADWCARLFPALANGPSLRPHDESWRPSPVRAARNWRKGKTALIGPAASIAHDSVGLGARTAMEHVEALVESLFAHASPEQALAAWQGPCLPKSDSLHRAARASADWLAHAHRAFDMSIENFAFACATRSLRLSYAHIRKADPDFVRSLDAIVAGPATGAGNETPPPMFAPYELRGMKSINRMVFSPMCMYSAKDGEVNDFHVTHLGTRAVGGFGLVIAEMTNVTAQGRMTPGCAGMYKPEHAPAWKRVVEHVHEHTQAKIGIQLAHAGRKGSIGRSWEKYEPVKGEEMWEVIAPSAIPFTPDRPMPREMTKADINATVAAFENAARMSEQAGFDMIEIHMAHGYLISEFISPLANRRGDSYGGSLENRMRFPLEVFEAVRAAFPADKPISARISASDFRPDGVTPEEAIVISRMLRDAGVDIVAVSTAGVTADRRPAAMNRLYQLALSEMIRFEAKVPTMTVGGLISPTDCNMVVASGRADMCAMARGALSNPYFPHHAAKQQGWRMKWPLPYDRAAETPVRME